MTTWPYFAL